MTPLPARTVERRPRFNRDCRRFTERLPQQKRPSFCTHLEEIITMLAYDFPLPASLSDHSCSRRRPEILPQTRILHVRPNVILMYRKVGDSKRRLVLLRLESHSTLHMGRGWHA